MAAGDFMYSPTSSLTDPPAHNPIAEGVMWVQGVALGSVSTTVAVVAVAAIGLLMLLGRLELRRGITVVVGCFLLFGAGIIASAITGFSSSDVAPKAPYESTLDQLGNSPHITAPPKNSTYDPYAGASVPVRR